MKDTTNMKKSILFFCSFLLFQITPAQKIGDISSVKNFHQIDEGVFRSGQPNKSDFKNLETIGIKQILNLRYHHTDKNKADGTTLILSNIKTNAGDLTEENLLEALQIIRNRKGNILIHCWHGSDRTGAVAAMYRIIYQNWTKEEAIEELTNAEYGYHKRYYKNIPKLIQDINIKEFKQKLDSLK